MRSLTRAGASNVVNSREDTMTNRDPSKLRSARWYAPNSMRASAHRQRTLAMGFRRSGTLERVGLKLGRWLDVILMQRELAAPAP